MFEMHLKLFGNSHHFSIFHERFKIAIPQNLISHLQSLSKLPLNWPPISSKFTKLKTIALFSSQQKKKKNIWKICCMHKNHETWCRNVLLCVCMCLVLKFFLPSWRQLGSLDPHLLCQFIVGVQKPFLH